MKEILKYLRQTNSLTQDEIAKKLEISRQWYIKYENGSVVPSEEIVKKLSEIYQVSKDFILQNKVPSIKDLQNSETHKKVENKIDTDFGKLAVADSGVATAVAVKKKTTTKVLKEDSSPSPSTVIEGYFDGKAIQIDTPEDIKQSFFQGQRFQIIPMYDEEEEKRRQNAWKKLQELVGTLDFSDMPPDKDPYYKEMISDAIVERYLYGKKDYYEEKKDERE